MKAVADHFGMTPSGLSSKLKREAELKGRIDRGLTRWLQQRSPLDNVRDVLDHSASEPVEPLIPSSNGHGNGESGLEDPAPSMPNQIEDLESTLQDAHRPLSDFKVNEAGDLKVLNESGVLTDSQFHRAKMTDEVLEELAFRGLTVREAGNQLDIPYNTFTYHLYKNGSENRHFEAWERGRAKREASIETGIGAKTEPAAGTLDQSLVPTEKEEIRPAAAVPSNGFAGRDSAELGKEVLEAIRDIKVADAAARSIPNQTFVEFARAGNLLVAFDGNFFAASRAERNLMNQIADLIQEHKENEADQ